MISMSIYYKGILNQLEDKIPIDLQLEKWTRKDILLWRRMRTLSCLHRDITWVVFSKLRTTSKRYLVQCWLWVDMELYDLLLMKLIANNNTYSILYNQLRCFAHALTFRLEYECTEMLKYHVDEMFFFFFFFHNWCRLFPSYCLQKLDSTCPIVLIKMRANTLIYIVLIF